MKARNNAGPPSHLSSSEDKQSGKGKMPVLLWLALFGMALSASAQSHSIDWSTIYGGGGTSTGGVYTVSGTIGQPDADTSGILVVNPATGGWFYRLNKPWR
jgi:hypothetical protein